MSTKTLNISLLEALKEHVQERVAEGACSSASDFVRALIRLDKEQQERLGALRRDIVIGIDQLDRGEGLDGERLSPSSRMKTGSARACPASSLPRRGGTFERYATTSPRTRALRIAS